MARGFFLESRELELAPTRRRREKAEEVASWSSILQKEGASWSSILQKERSRELELDPTERREKEGASWSSIGQEEKKRKRGLIVLLGWGRFGELLAFCLCF